MFWTKLLYGGVNSASRVFRRSYKMGPGDGIELLPLINDLIS
jgi:hypothetical protein